MPSLDMLSFFMPSLDMVSFFMASLDMVSFFMPSSLPILSWAKAAGASARPSETTAVETPSAIRERIVMDRSSFLRVVFVESGVFAAFLPTIDSRPLLPVLLPCNELLKAVFPPWRGKDLDRGQSYCCRTLPPQVPCALQQ